MVRVRQARAEDIVTITQLAYDLLPERYSTGVFTTLFERFPHGLFVAEEDSEIIGFLIGVIPVEDSSRVLMLGVVPAYRCHGVGSELLSSFESAMNPHHVSSIHLEVLTTNEAAISFYRKNGFEIQERMKNFYVTGEDAFFMRKKITASPVRVPSRS